MSDPTVSVVIRCFNEEAHIGRLLSGLARQSRPPDQIVVVDSGSTDATLEIAARFPVEIHGIEPAQFSFGRSLNIGCGAARGELLVLASAHVYPVYDSWLTELIGPLADSEVALAYGRQVGGGRTKYSETRVMERWFPAHSDRHQAHPFCNNANAVIRRSVWESLPYNEELTGLEDLDWAKRASGQGWKVAYVAEAPVVHAHDESWGEVANRYRREAIAHRRIFHDQRMGALEAVRLALANIVSDYTHAARDGVLAPNLAAIPMFRAAQFWGTYRGFAQRGEASAVLRRRFYYPHGLRRPAPAEPLTNAHAIDYDETEQPGADARAN